MKNSLSFFLVLALLGCATSQTKVLEQKNTPEQNYRISGYEKALVIKGTLAKIQEQNSQPQQMLKVYINDELALNDVLVNEEDELKGRWHRHKISANCYKDTRGQRCLVYVGNQRTVTLSFNNSK